MYKYYIDGKLVRTSDHIYSHAVINTKNGKVIGCRANEQNAQAIITSAIHAQEVNIRNAKSHINAILNGKKTYKVIDGRKSYYDSIGNETAEEVEKWMNTYEAAIEGIRKNWDVLNCFATSELEYYEDDMGEAEAIAAYMDDLGGNEDPRRAFMDARRRYMRDASENEWF